MATPDDDTLARARADESAVQAFAPEAPTALEAALHVLALYADWDPSLSTHATYHNSVKPLFHARVDLLIAATNVARRAIAEDADAA